MVPSPDSPAHPTSLHLSLAVSVPVAPLVLPPTPASRGGDRFSPTSAGRVSVSEKARHLGIVDVKSKLHMSADRRRRFIVRWHPMDWLLGTKYGQFVGLVVVAHVLIACGGMSWILVGGNVDYGTTWWQASWFSWAVFFDPGTQMGLAADETAAVKGVAVAFSVLGFVYNLLFLGLIVDIVRNMLEYWRKKRSRIVANEHTILLGWTEKSLFVMEELMKSAENRGVKLEMVVLADADQFMMWQEICRHFKNPAQQRTIQIRYGSPCECDDLLRVSAVSAREIIILGGSGPPRQVDLTTVRTIVALAALQQQPKGVIIAEVRTAETSPAISAVLDTAEGIFARDAVKRVLCLTAVCPVIGDVFQNLMSWVDGSEIYCKTLQDLGVPSAKTFGDAQRSITEGVVIGVRPSGRHAIMSPPDEQMLEPTDRLLVLAESQVDIVPQAPRARSVLDALTFRSRKKSFSGGKALRSMTSSIGPSEVKHSLGDAQQAQTVIVIGWPNDIDDLLIAMDDYIAFGSKVVIMSKMDLAERTRRLHNNRSEIAMKNFRIEHRIKSTTSLPALAGLLSDHRSAAAVLVLADDALDEDPKMSDSACLASAITIDALLRGRHERMYAPCEQRPRLIVEVLSPVVERALPPSHQLRERMTFFHSGALETGLFTIASAQTPVFNSLLLLLQPNTFGELALMPPQAYACEDVFQPSCEGAPGGVADYAEIFRRVRGAGDVLLGSVGPASSGVVLNPKRAGVVLQEDRLVVIKAPARDMTTSRSL